jgi:glycosyltransferase involved in cell wall biosynthesis
MEAPARLVARDAVPVSNRVASLRVLTVMNCGRHEANGMPVANASLSAAMRELGCAVDNLYLDDYPGVARRPSLRYVLFGLMTAGRVRAMEAANGPFDVVQISGGDGFLAPLLRRDHEGHRRLVVARCHGLEHRYWQAFRCEARDGRLRASLRHRLYFGGLRLKEVEWSIRGADLLNCHTEEDADYVVARGWKRRDQVLVLPGGIESDWFGVAPGTGEPPKRLLFCGSWTWMKGPRILADVFRRLALSHDGMELTVAGAGVEPEVVLRDFAAEVRSRVRVLQRLAHRDVLEEFRRHDVLLGTSLFEGFGTVVLEAMAAGLPVVASAAGVAPRYIEHGRCGFLAEPGDVDGFVEAFETLAGTDSSERRAMSFAAMAAVSGITWATVAAATVRAYAEAARAVGRAL